MSTEKKHNIRHHQMGVSIVELMVSIVLGLLLLGAATAMTVSSMVINAETLGSVRLNQNLDSVSQVMVNEIRRAGFSGGVFDYAVNEDLNIVSASCVLYAYDANDNGAKDDAENFGFKLVGNEIHMRTTCTGACSASCATGTWAPLTDDDIVSITGLGFTSQNSKCLSLTHPDNVAALTNENNFWITTSTTATQFPCMATVGTGLTTYVLDASNDYIAGTFVAPAAKDRLIGSRQVNVNISAALTADAATDKNQTVAINVRNYRVRSL